MGLQGEIKNLHDKWVQQLNDVEKFSFDFSRIKTDEGRVKYVLDHFEKLPPNLKLKAEGKSSLKSQTFRESGNKCFKNKEYADALTLYNKSIAYAPFGSKELAISYGNRAACLLSLKKPLSALSDVNRALKLEGIDADYKKKLLKRQKECKKSTKDVEEEPQTVHIPPLPTQSDYFDCTSHKIDLLFNEDVGRHLMANEHVCTGEILMVETPYASMLVPGAIYTHCCYCHKKSWTLLPCKNCNSSLFCSDACIAASKIYHDVECSVLEHLLQLGLLRLDMLSLRILLVASDCGKDFSKVTAAIKDEPKIFESHDFYSVYSLVGNTESRKVADLFRRTFTAGVVVTLLDNLTDIFEKQRDFKDFAGGVILRFMQSMPCNAHEITEFIDGENVEIGGGAYPTVSLMNHSCDPNVVRSSLGKTIVLRAIRPIQKGDEIVDNYGYHYATEPCESRLSSLKWQYYFTCCCEACTNKWPKYADFPSNGPVFKTHGIISRSEYDRRTEEFEEKWEQVLKKNITQDLLEFLCRYLDFLDLHVERPWQNYNKCQEGIKYSLNFLPNFTRIKQK